MPEMILACTLLLVLAEPVSAQLGSGAKLFTSTSHDFGSVPRGAELLHRFSWTNPERARLEILEARSTCGCARVSLQPRVLEPGQTGTVDVLVDTKPFAGPKTVPIHLLIGPDPVRTVTLQVTANSRPDIVCNPGQVNFGVVAEGATPTQIVEIEYAGPLDWRVHDLVNPSDCLEASLEEMYRRPGQIGYRVKVALKPNAPAGDLKQELLLKTNDPVSPVVPVLVEATVRASLTLVPERVYFSRARANERASRRVTLYGDKPFRILRVEGATDGLEVSIPSHTAKVHNLVIVWQPSQAGELNRRVTVHTDMPRYEQFQIDVQGEAAP